MISKKVF